MTIAAEQSTGPLLSDGNGNATAQRSLVAEVRETEDIDSLGLPESAYRLHFSCDFIGKYRRMTKRHIKWYVVHGFTVFELP